MPNPLRAASRTAALLVALLALAPLSLAAQAQKTDSLARGRRVLSAAVRAAGGAEFASVRTLEVSESGQVRGPHGMIDVRETYLIAFPGRIRVSFSILGRNLVEVLDGEQGWMATGPRSAALSLAQIENLRRRVLLGEGVGVYRAALAGAVHVRWLGPQTVRGRTLLALAWQTDTGPIKLYVDPATHLVSGASYNASMSGRNLETVELWSDFRVVNGLHLPFRMVGYQAGARFSAATVNRVRVNVPVDPKLFLRPPARPASPRR